MNPPERGLFLREQSIQGGAADLGAFGDLGLGDASLQCFARSARDFLQRLALTPAGSGQVRAQLVQGPAELDVWRIVHAGSVKDLRQNVKCVTLRSSRKRPRDVGPSGVMAKELEVPMQAERTDSWQDDVLDAGAEKLDAAGAVVVRLTTDGPQVVSRVYSTDDYETPSNEAATSKLRRVAVRRATQLLNQDHGGWNYYVVIRYASGQLVAWTGMHSILCERDGDES